MTFLLPHDEVLDFTSDVTDMIPALPIHTDVLLQNTKDISKIPSNYTPIDDKEFSWDFLSDINNNSMDGILGFPICEPPLEPTYEIVTEHRRHGDHVTEHRRQQVLQEMREGLKLRLRVSNSICLGGAGSVGSSPSEVTSDNEVLNVEEFLNLPTPDFVTLEESKQALHDMASIAAPSPSYSLSSSGGPSPHHSALISAQSPLHSSLLSSPPAPPVFSAPVFSARTTTISPSPPRDTPLLLSPPPRDTPRHTGSVCRVIPVQKSNVIDITDVDVPAAPPDKTARPDKDKPCLPESGTPAPCSLFTPAAKCVPSPRHRAVSGQRAHVTAARDSPASSTARNAGVLKKYYDKTDLLLKSREKEVEEVEMKESANKLKQGVVIGSMERGPRMFGVRYGPCDRPNIEDTPHLETPKSAHLDIKMPEHLYSQQSTGSYSTQSTPMQAYNPQQTSPEVHMVMNQQMKLNANSKSPKLPKTTSIPPNFHLKQSPRPESALSKPDNILVKRSIKDKTSPERLRTHGNKCPIPKAKIELPPVSHQTNLHSRLKESGKCKRNVAAIRSPNKRLTDMFYQKHLYCSVEKPLFESDPDVLKHSEMYQLMLNTYLSLEAQRTEALKDLDKIENSRASIKKRPYKFIKQLQKGEIVFPTRQRVTKVPEVNITYRNKNLSIGKFRAPSGQMVSKHSEEFSKKIRLKKEPENY